MLTFYPHGCMWFTGRNLYRVKTDNQINVQKTFNISVLTCGPV